MDPTDRFLPDYDRAAARLDAWFALLDPVSAALIDRLPTEPGGRVLDVACGTGEPGLTLARRSGGSLRVVGVDAAPGMVAAARAKAAAGGLAGAEFAVMPADRLDFPAAAFDGVLCRFGLMLFEDMPAAAAEMGRVLRPGGRYAVAVWRRPAENALYHLAGRAFDDHLPPDLRLSSGRACRLGEPGALDALLRGAGLPPAAVEVFRFDIELPTPAAVWELFVTTGAFDRQLSAVSAGAADAMRTTTLRLAGAFARGGGLVLPHACLIASGQR